MAIPKTVGPRASLALVLLVMGLVLTSCDIATTGSTAILNAESAIPPRVDYTFEYTPSDVAGDSRVEVVSEERDELKGILSKNGFSRTDVVSAEIDSVSIERLSAPTFEYITGADIYLGTDASGPHIATGTVRPSQESALLDVPTKTVTDLVKQGRTNAFARIAVSDRSRIPDVDRVGVTVFFRIEVKGV